MSLSAFMKASLLVKERIARFHPYIPRASPASLRSSSAPRESEWSRRAFHSGRLFDQGRNRGNTTGLLVLTETQKAALFDPTQVAPQTRQITNATNANPVVYTSVAHGAVNGDTVLIGGIQGNLSANQLGRIAAVTANTFQLVTLDGAGLPVAGSGAYTVGGFMVNLTQAQFVADIIVGNGRAGTDATLTTPATSKGVFTSDNWTWLTVAPGYVGQQVFAYVIYDSAGGSDATNKLDEINDGKIRVVCNTAANGGDVSVKVEALKGGIPLGGVLAFSNGQLATLSAPALMGDRAVTVTALGGAITAGATAEAIVTAAGLPLFPNSGNIQFTVGAIYAPGLPTGHWML